MRVGIIGATGWLGSALGAGLLRHDIVAPHDLMLLNSSGPRADYHGHTDVVWSRTLVELVEQSDVVVVSVRPEHWQLLNLQAEGRLVLSFMAGIDGRKLDRCGGRIVRAMPNVAAEMGGSYSPYWAAGEVTHADHEMVRKVLSAIGTTDQLANESEMDLMTALPGSGAAYPALMAAAMADFMRARGMSETIAWRAAAAAAIDGARMLEGRIAEAPALLAAYRSYRGTTAAGLDAAEIAGFSRAIHAALEAATDNARQMAGDANEPP